jgi:hypothetical protein
MLLTNYLNAVRDGLKAAFPELRQCELHAGDVNAKELGRIAAHAPALLISLGAVGVAEEVGDGRDYWPLTPVVYVVTRDERSLNRFEAAVNLVEGVIDTVTDNIFGIVGARAPQDIAAKNLFTGDIDKQKVSLWAVRFSQRVIKGQTLFADGGEMAGQLYVGITPDIGPAHIDDYVEVKDEL